jgi:hypothetical protein
MPMKIEFAQYIQDLQFGAENTSQAEDRGLYTKYLAEAGVILSSIILGADKEELEQLVNDHDRLWGQTWLIDPVHDKAAKSYKTFKQIHNF